MRGKKIRKLERGGERGPRGKRSSVGAKEAGARKTRYLLQARREQKV